jgi:HAD superfamily hydrolase (TIGR01549 family)
MITTVLFDLDDTLTDAAVFGATMLHRAAAEHGQALPVAVIQQYPGVSYLPLAQQLLGVSGHEAAAIYATYVRRYAASMATDLRERDGATEVIRALRAAEVRVGLVTNKLERLAREILTQFGWDEHFGVVVGQDTCAVRKPDPGVVRHALGVLGGRAESTLLIGDTVADMQCARDAGIAVIVGYLGTTDGALLTRSGATHLASDLREVTRIVARG